MLKNIFTSLIDGFLPLLKFILYPLGFIFVVFCILLFVWFIYYFFFKKRRRERIAKINRVLQPNPFIKLFYLAPKHIVDNYFNSKIGCFREHGIVLFEGKQGSGKTLTITQHLNILREKYPEAKILTNYGYKFEDDEISDWHRMLTDNNGEKGIVYAIDEMPNWFSSADSKNFPTEMLEVVTQNRKNRRVIFGTCHTFSMVAKPIRIQTTEVRKCRTILNCITIVKRLEPVFDSAGDVERYIPKGFYWFVHSDLLYNSYDTLKVIHRYKEREQDGVNNFYDYDTTPAYLRYIASKHK